MSGAVVLGLLNVGYFALAGRPWGITTELTYWASGLWRLLGFHPESWAYFAATGRVLPGWSTLWAQAGSALNVGVVAGAFLASYLAGEWRIRRPKNLRHVDQAR